ncbi:MAG: 50S ribosomal protein L5 [Puniceicoccales bacterium]|nr:50S ribosomal protein L5 [Puniceicoccales bacterium]
MNVATKKIPALRRYYADVIVKDFLDRIACRNAHRVPKLVKVVINSAISAESDKAWIEEILKEVGMIAGRKPVITHSKRSISNFKLRAGVPNGVKVTLRGDAMYEFVYRLISVALPRIRDFRGLRAKFDGQGNYTLGIQDDSIFLEVGVDRERKSVGMDITFVTSTSSDVECHELLESLGMPFQKRRHVTEAQEA